MKESEQVATICEALGLRCRPSVDVEESDWAAWLDAWPGIPIIRTCPECGESMAERSGKYGKFLGCSGYPGCKHTEPAGG